MQTFLPYKSFIKTAKCLDYQRLNKQRSEAFGINYLIYKHIGKDKRRQYNISDQYAELLWRRYKNHPAVLMWIGYNNALKQYYNTIVQEWIDRDYKNNMPFLRIHGKTICPSWLGVRKFHSSHKANLLRKDFIYYSKFNWKEKPSDKYYWPIRKENKK